MRLFLLVSLAATFLFFVPDDLSAQLTLTHLSTQEELDELIDVIAFVGEGRIGGWGFDKISLHYEIGLGTNPDDLEKKRKYSWSNGSAVPFELTYDPGNNKVVFEIGGKKLSFTPEDGGSATDIAVRTYAENRDTEIKLINLVLNGEELGEELAVRGDDGLDILRIQGASPAGGLHLEGIVILQWAGHRPSGGDLAFHVGAFRCVRTTGTETTSWGEIKNKFR